MSNHTGRLVLTTAEPQVAPDSDLVRAVLTQTGFIGPPLGGGEVAYAVGPGLPGPVELRRLLGGAPRIGSGSDRRGPLPCPHPGAGPSPPPAVGSQHPGSPLPGVPCETPGLAGAAAGLAPAPPGGTELRQLRRDASPVALGLETTGGIRPSVRPGGGGVSRGGGADGATLRPAHPCQRLELAPFLRAGLRVERVCSNGALKCRPAGRPRVMLSGRWSDRG